MRLLHNFVAAALSLVDHTRVLYRQLYEPCGEIPEYQDRVTKSFAEEPLVQFVIKLRQMAQHYRLPSLENQTEISDVKNGVTGTVRIRLRLRMEDLRQFDGWNAPANKFLADAGSHIDLRTVITGYFAEVTAFYSWFDQRQREVHGIGPDLVHHLSMHGLSTGPRPEVAELSKGIDALERKPKEKITFADMEAAFAPVLSIVDSRRLLLCRHDGRKWIEVALAAAQSRFTVAPDLADPFEIEEATLSIGEETCRLAAVASGLPIGAKLPRETAILSQDVATGVLVRQSHGRRSHSDSGCPRMGRRSFHLNLAMAHRGFRPTKSYHMPCRSDLWSARSAFLLSRLSLREVRSDLGNTHSCRRPPVPGVRDTSYPSPWEDTLEGAKPYPR